MSQLTEHNPRLPLNTIISSEKQALAQEKEVPLLRFQQATGTPSWALGVLPGLFFFALLTLPAWLALEINNERALLGNALFFAASFAILATFTNPVYRGAAADLRALAPILPIDHDELEQLARCLTRSTRAQVQQVALLGLLLGVAHCWVLDVQYLPLLMGIPQAIAVLSLWLMMTTTIWKMVDNAIIFSKLGAVAQPDLLRPSRQAPFGSAALRPGIFLIGILCAYSLLALDGTNPLEGGGSVGFVASLVSLTGITVLPLRGIRDRIKTRRSEITQELDERLERLGGDDLGEVTPEVLRNMSAILDMRERVSQAPGWPVDLAAVQRFLLYVILPPITWAAAAFVEMAIDGVIN